MESKAGIYSLLVLCAVLTLVSLFMIGNIKQEKVPSASDIASKIVVPNNAYNDSAIKADLAAVKSTVTKDDAWKSAAQSLATSEWNDKSYKDLYNWMDSQNISIYEKSDIKSVVVRDSKVTSFDAEEKDADVWQELKVYFEDKNGENQKIYVEVETSISDNDVEDQEFLLN